MRKVSHRKCETNKRHKQALEMEKSCTIVQQSDTGQSQQILRAIYIYIYIRSICMQLQNELQSMSSIQLHVYSIIVHA